MQHKQEAEERKHDAERRAADALREPAQAGSGGRPAAAGKKSQVWPSILTLRQIRSLSLGSLSCQV